MDKVLERAREITRKKAGKGSKIPVNPDWDDIAYIEEGEVGSTEKSPTKSRHAQEVTSSCSAHGKNPLK